MGYDCSRPEKSYKIVGYTYTDHLRIAIYEFATNAWKFIDEGKSKIQQWLCYNSVSLNGNLYWPACDLDRQFFIRILDCSKEILKTFCTVPCKKKASLNTHVLAVFKGDRFSLLEQCDKTREIEIWVTKKKITNGDDGDDVVWIKFMSVSIPNFTWLHKEGTSYFVDNNIYGKSLVLCCRDKTRQACVYIVRGDKCRKIEIDDVVGELRHCSVYVPSLIPIP